ncbi:MAG: hypothetical protein A2504_15590 [Bdellovibrionales bacterium RIFOXYD12_FULL_39_22]|nr:MAG: hypothetical protein A2385_03020 [Bdellovibrionales bacterium RIFOXYB1_FULL_39_21]OFZ43216.1 MAG: hypothetical protein A2485_12165 [Bdellovibrionales bacterium RIFOXYC12_FULL_39_17]OFZ47954.1 MAG: hypothetical protein A2404_16805 [Bdellovibrionales bacterium RIFOXYC1_FULL_39_130]OFZ75734.1 MAG: hypothetical protein A2560_13305 [Bdellovibrionales bacterium RIFOXYD1_FULL_39_84]OFZ94224.1 MAG: hypothetical protein A2504_15590 [Bdellovibrionales bacterium RIFOXYD12_FULL_39_22]HLE11706.1 3-
MRYYLLDKITQIKVDESASGIKCISFTDEVLHDHFPDNPIMPGALIVEGVAQLAGFLLEVSYNKSDDNIVRAVLCQIDKMKFYKMSVPGDQLIYNAKILSKMSDAAQVAVEVFCKEELHAQGKITFQLLPIDSENVNNQRRSLYKIWTKGVENCPTLR